MTAQAEKSLDRSWLAQAVQKIAELSALPENWDGYGSRSIQQTAVEQASSLLPGLASFNLPAPQIFPVPGGGIQLEFQQEARELEIEILPDGSMEYLTMNEEGQMSEGFVLPADIYRLAHWLQAELLAAA